MSGALRLARAAGLLAGLAFLHSAAAGLASAESLGDNPFRVSARAIPTPGDSLGDFRVEVEIEAPEGTYLYAERTAVLIPGEPAAAGPFFEKGITKYDAFEERELEIYKGQARARAHVRSAGRRPEEVFPVVVVAEYQGCTSEFCYFPQSETLRVALGELPPAAGDGATVAGAPDAGAPAGGAAAGDAAAGVSAPASSGGVDIAGKIATQGYLITYLGVFVSGILLSFTPCVFPLIPITVGVIGARGAGSLGRGFGLSLAYVVGLALTYAILGVVAARTGALFGSLLQNPWVIGFVVTIFLTLALSMFGLYEIQVPPSIAGKLSGGKKQGVIGVFFMGIISGLVASPCVGPVILGLLVFIATTGSAVLGFTLLLTLGFGMGLLFLVIGTFSGAISALPRAGVWMDRVKEFFGVLLVAMALYFLRPLMGPIVFASITGVTLLVLAGFGGVFEPGAKGWIDRTRRTILLVFLAAGIALTGGAILHSGLVLPPPSSGGGAGATAEAPGIRWMTSESEGIEAARLAGQPAILDFTADWCLVCHEIDKEVLHDPRVIEAAKSFVPIRLDFTRVDDAARALQAKYAIRGLPSIVFLDRQGRVIPELTLTGLVPPEEFLDRMRRAAS